jgi:Nuclear pore protein 84 / 107
MKDLPCSTKDSSQPRREEQGVIHKPLTDIVDALYESYGDNNVFRIFQSFIIIDQHQKLIDFAVNYPTLPLHFLRFVTLFILLLRTCEIQRSNTDNIVIERYTRGILRSASISTVGFLCQRMDYTSQTNVFAEFLVKRMGYRREIHKGLRACEELMIDLGQVARIATCILFDQCGLFVRRTTDFV